ncbi:hypothetical protein AOL_s00097g274 [Orbilia oligospora ATCC 24927]|uniref:Cytochrome P450 n=1 Tax=Arthrobotrys oligospora (strain ATCC 24927 / CBS 115.81 / DSM 1491) TaxID=756982 RepID=G1XIU7_ARTOA|nr:hypothetical protein AOL_s00097g274 [Orbilia oligospora ATCC 24927]EGX46848.1 hypothetical protein AOL_s00097g274 [Orbilia oligospora ATCC 24927]
MIAQVVGFDKDLVLPSILVAFSVLAGYVAIQSIYYFYFHPLASLPGPFFARITDLYGGYHAWTGRHHYHLYELHKKYGPVIRYGPNRVSFNSATAVKDIYGATKPLRKSAGYRALLLSGNVFSLFTSIDKSFHGKRRRIMSHGFSDAALRSYEPIVQERIDKFLEILTKEAGADGWGASKNMSRLCAGLTFDVMGALVFGQPFKILEDESGLSYVIDAIISASRSVGVMVHLPVFGKNNILFKIRGLFRLLFLSLKDLKNIKAFLALSAKLTRERTAQEAAKTAGEDIVKAQGVPNKDILGWILAATDPETGEHLSLSDVWGEARVLIIAGSDTTSTSLSGALYYLSRNPVILNKLRTELRTTFSSEDEIWPGQKINSCSYLKHVIEEALRMSSPVGGILWREAAVDHVVQGVTIPAGTDCGVPVYSIHHHTDYFHDPHVFNPDRWDENIVGAEAVAAAKSAWIPFQIGSRGCIGRPLANMELTLTLARIIYSFEIRVDESKRGVGQADVIPGHTEFETKDQLTAETTGPFLQFKKIEA